MSYGRVTVASTALGVFVLLSGARVLPAQAPAQNQPPRFSSDVTVLQVDARVFDRDGRFVPTLTKDDFEVFEQGVRQTVDSCELVGYVDSQSAASGTSSSLPRAMKTEPHTWIFLFDRKHLTPGQFARVRAAVEQFIQDRFKDGDIAGIVDGDRMVFDRISSSRTELLAAIRRITPPSEQASRASDATHVGQITGDDPAAAAMREVLEPFGKAEAERAALDVLNTSTQLFDGLAAIAGIKTVVLASAGFGLTRFEGTARNVVRRATRAGARVYAIDPMGLERVGGPPDLLNMLSVDTGGMVIFNENNFGRALDTIAADARVYYLLGYRPRNRRYDGRYREIDVRVKGPGLTVRARRGYLAVDPSTLRSPSGR
jgi:VWFA-related protein